MSRLQKILDDERAAMKRARRRDVMRAIAKLTVEKATDPKNPTRKITKDAKVKLAVEQFRTKKGLSMMDSERSVYRLLKPKKRRRRKA